MGHEHFLIPHGAAARRRAGAAAARAYIRLISWLMTMMTNIRRIAERYNSIAEKRRPHSRLLMTLMTHDGLIVNKHDDRLDIRHYNEKRRQERRGARGAALFAHLMTHR